MCEHACFNVLRVDILLNRKVSALEQNTGWAYVSSNCIFACLAYGLSNRSRSALEQNAGWTCEQ